PYKLDICAILTNKAWHYGDTVRSTMTHLARPRPRSVRPLIVGWFRPSAGVLWPLLGPTGWERVGGCHGVAGRVARADRRDGLHAGRRLHTDLARRRQPLHGVPD